MAIANSGRQCIEKPEKMNVDKLLKIKIDRLVDTRLPKQAPPVEAVLLNIKAKKLLKQKLC